jgi:cobalt-zinc-cadmium efflux system outer membrane protein
MTVPAGSAPSRTPLSLEDAVELARRHSPALSAVAGRMHIAAGESRQYAAIPNPTLEWRDENLDSPLQRDRFLTLQLPVDYTGSAVAARMASGAGVSAARSDSAAAARNVEYGVARAYHAAALAEGRAEIATRQRVALEALADAEAVRSREGAVAEVVAMRTANEAARARLVEGAALAEAQRARATLARAIGLPADSIGVPMPPDRQSPLSVPSVEEATAQAMATRPDLRAAKARAREMGKRLTAARLGSAPPVSVVGGYKQTAGYDTYVLGVSVGIPFFDRKGGARERALGERMTAEADLRAAEGRVRTEVAAALVAYRILTEAGDADGLAARAAEVVDVAQASYAEGATSLLELLAAQQAHADAAAAVLLHRTELALARLEINRALGAPIIEAP